MSTPSRFAKPGLAVPLPDRCQLFVFAQVQAVENRVGRTLCPVRLLRQLRSWFR